MTLLKQMEGLSILGGMLGLPYCQHLQKISPLADGPWNFQHIGTTDMLITTKAKSKFEKIQNIWG